MTFNVCCLSRLTEADVYTAARTSSLAPHQLPARVHLLDSLPLTSHGKTDRAQLRAAISRTPDSSSAEAPSAAEVRSSLQLSWRAVLGSDPADEDNFVVCGGDSFSALALVNLIHR